MPTARPDSYVIASGADLYAGIAAPSPAPSPTITLSALSGGNPVAGTAFSFSALLNNPGTLPLTGTPENVSGSATFSPTTVGWSSGDLNKAFSATWAAAGAASLRVTAPGGLVSNTVSVTVQAAPPPPPSPANTATLSLASTGTTGSPTTGSVSLNGTAPAAGSITLSGGAGATVTPSTLSWTSGESGAPKNFTVSYAADGVHSVSASSGIAGVTMAGSPASHTTSTAASTGTPQPFTLNSSGSGVLPFAIGYAMSQGHVPSGQSLSFAGATAKLTVLSTWPDGSARHGIIAGTYTSAGSAVTVTPTVATVTAGTALTGAAVQTAMGANTAVFDAGAFGTATFSGADFASPFKTHAATDTFIEAIYRKAVGADAHLVAWLSLRVWSSGQVEALPWIENGYLNVASPTNKSATYSFTLGGTSRFSAAIDIPNHCRTPLLSGAALSHWLGTDPGVTARHDAAYLMATELVPTYWATVSPSASIVTGLPSTFTPLQQGSYPSSMGSAGYDPSIGILPEWDVLYLTTTANVSAAIQRNAYSAGRYGIHHRDETTNRVPRFSSYPTTVLGDGTGIASVGSSTTSTFTPNATGTAPADFAPSHMPSMGFMAYLITGRFYHLETMQFAVTANHFRSSTAPREDASGILQTWSATSTRGAAWGLRSLAQAVAMTPDSDTTIRTELLNAYAANISRHHATYVAGSNGSMGFMQPYTNYTASISQNAGAGSTSTDIVLPGGTTSTSGEYAKVFSNGGGWTITIGGETRSVTAWDGPSFTATVSPAFTVTTASQPSVLRSNHWYEASWQQDFYTAALGYAGCLGIGDSTTRTQWAAFFDWKARSIVGRFGGVSATEYLYRDAAAYEFPVAENDTTWTATYTDWGKVWTDAELQNARGTKVLGDGSLRGTTTDLSSYWGNLQPALAYAIRHSAYGAAEARALMESAPNWAALAATGNDYPVWAVKPRTPSWLSGMAVNQWKELTGTLLSAQPGIDTGASSGKQDAWAGWHADTATSKVYSAGQGGHGDYFGNEVDMLDLRANAPAWTQLQAASPAATVDFNSDYGSDGKPKSVHGYYTSIVVNTLGKGLRFFGGSKSTSGFAYQKITAFDLDTGAWDAESVWTALTAPDTVGANNGAYAKHPVTEKVYIWIYNARICVWDPASPLTTTLLISNPSNPAMSGTAAACDPTRGTGNVGEVFFLGGGSGGTVCRVYDIGANSLRTITLTGVDISGPAYGGSLVYVRAMDKYIACIPAGAGASEVYAITPNTGTSWACSLIATTGGGGIPLTNDSSAHWPWSKFLYLPEFGAAVYGPRWGSNVWALKLHEV